MTHVDYILTLLPDFCWQTSFEILTMIEQEDDKLEGNVLCCILRALHLDGLVMRRPFKRHYTGELIKSPSGWRSSPIWEYKGVSRDDRHVEIMIDKHRTGRLPYKCHLDPTLKSRRSVLNVAGANP